MTAPLAFGAALRPLWRLAEDIAYLNHGGFGATPIAVLEAQAALRDRIEAAPGPFFAHEFPGLIRAAAGRVAAWLGVSDDSLVFVDNATSGVNAVLASLPLAAGDEILLTSATYGAVRNAALFAARRAGARVVEAALPWPPTGAEAVLAAVGRAIGPATRLAILDHIVSESGVVLPIAQLVALCHAQGVPVLVDGAHAPGQVPVDLAAIDADWYTANLHKWAFAPRSAAILWAREERRPTLHPCVISWGLDQGMTREFDWVGTRDPTPWLAAPAGLDFLARLGPERLAAHNHALVRAAGARLADAWGTTVVTPPAMTAAMLVVPLPGQRPASRATADAARQWLWREHRIEVPIIAMAGRLWARLSAQAYNDIADYDRLGRAVRGD